MAQKIFTHNITQGIYNEEMLDAWERAEQGDIIKFSYAGNSIVFDLLTLEEDTFSEYGYVRRAFLEGFEDFHGSPFTQ